MVDKTQHLRERFYQGLKKEIHQKMTPFYRDEKISYMQLLKIAREIEDELWPEGEGTVKGAKEANPQVNKVLEALKDLKKQVEKTVEPDPPQKPK